MRKYLITLVPVLMLSLQQESRTPVGFRSELTDDPRRPEAELLARGIWSGLHGYVSLKQARTGKGWPDERDFVSRLSRAWLGDPRPTAAQ